MSNLNFHYKSLLFIFYFLVSNFLISAQEFVLDLDKKVLDARNADMRKVLNELARKANINLLLSPKIQGTITCYLSGLEPEEIIYLLAKSNGFVLEKHGNIIIILPHPQSTGKVRFEIITLQNANSKEVSKIIQNLKIDKNIRITHDERTNKLIVIYDE